MKRLLTLGAAALLLIIALAFGWLIGTEAGLRWAWDMARLASGQRLHAAAVEGTLAGRFRIDGLAFRSPAADVRIARLEADWSPLMLLLGRLKLDHLGAGNVSIATHPAPAPEPSETGPPAFTPLIMPLPVIVEDARVDGLVVHRDGEERFVLERARLSARLDDRGLAVADAAARGPWGAIALSGRVGNGPAAPVALEVDWRAALPRLAAPLEGRGRVRGTVERPQIEQRLIAPVAARLTGHVQWLGQEAPVWQAELSSDGLALERLLANARPLQLAGRITAEGRGIDTDADLGLTARDPEFGGWRLAGGVALADGRLTLNELALAEIDGTARAVTTGSARLDGPGLHAIDVALTWEALRWPLETPQVHSPRGRLAMSGALSDYRVQLQAQVARQDLPPAALTATGQGDHKALRLGTIKAQWLDGTLHGQAEAAWSPGPTGTLQLTAAGLDPALLIPEMPGAVDFRIEASGRLGPDGPTADAELSELGGTLRGESLQGGAAVHYAQGSLAVERLRLRLGNAELAGSGQLGERVSAEWRLDAPTLEQVHPDLAGAVKARGRISGQPASPALEATAEARNLRAGPVALARLDAALDIDLGSDRPGQLSVTARKLAPPTGPVIDRLALVGEGRTAAHRLALDVRSGDTTLAQRADGAFANGRWRLQLHDGRLAGAPPGTWNQQIPTVLLWGDGGIRLDRFCWSAAQARACAEVAPGPTGPVVTADLAGFPATVANAFIPGDDIALAGRVDADVRFAGLEDLTLKARLHEGRASYAATEQRPLEITLESARVSAVATADGLSAEMELVEANRLTIRGRFNTPDWPLRQGSALDGAVMARVDRLDWLALLAPQLLEPTGRLRADLGLAGRWGEPVITGTARLENGSALVIPAGIRINALRLQARVHESDRIELGGSARSGPGNINIRGTVTGTPRQWQLQLALTGRRFEAARLPQAQLLVSPDLNISAAPNDIRLRGTLRVDQGEISLPEFGDTAAVAASPDVVVVNGSGQEPEQRWATHADVVVELGDAVRLSGYGFEGRLGGRLAIREQPGKVATATGELLILEGRYEAYGQELTVTQGRLRYAGNPINDPALDFRAIRQVEEVTVGIVVSGTLQSPELRLFSEPPMDDSNALAYLVLGRPLSGDVTESEGNLLYRAALSLGFKGGNVLASQLAEQFGIEEVELESGPTPQESALVLGTHLSPRLYLQYAIGFAEAVNRLRVRYDLGGHWTLEAESGEHTSTDLLFTIER